jgi:hypothetical protein
MDIVLIILGVLGVGAIAVSAYVFTVAARNYVWEDQKKQQIEAHRNAVRAQMLVPRSSTDRRSGKPVTFPLTVNGMLITADRRHQPDRRKAA